MLATSLFAAPLCCCRSRSCRRARPILLRTGLLAAEMGGAASFSARSATKLCGVSVTGASLVPLFLAALADSLLSP